MFVGASPITIFTENNFEDSVYKISIGLSDEEIKIAAHFFYLRVLIETRISCLKFYFILFHGYTEWLCFFETVSTIWIY